MSRMEKETDGTREIRPTGKRSSGGAVKEKQPGAGAAAAAAETEEAVATRVVLRGPGATRTDRRGRALNTKGVGVVEGRQDRKKRRRRRREVMGERQREEKERERREKGKPEEEVQRQGGKMHDQ
ncbi:Hypothetical predicted protein [Xyrichtys novacula]|uniref:Uncharacterized protein n=1 Tax=Xyrichtys novacula TaxID=13765 RepID=A0AAV1G2X7_XYRNO|nr:Hypothetical predicted protein [Xyrichtys novacula]